jgi:hypothetical protein
LIRNGLTSIEAIRVPASTISLDRPTRAFDSDGERGLIPTLAGLLLARYR